MDLLPFAAAPCVGHAHPCRSPAGARGSASPDSRDTTPADDPARGNAIARRRTRAAPEIEALLKLIRTTLDDHKAADIAVIDLHGKSTIGDFMVVASGTSSRHVIALAEELTRVLKAHGIKGVVPEGTRQGDWVLIDAGDIIVHLFRPEVRAFYGLEKMWEADLETTARGPSRAAR